MRPNDKSLVARLVAMLKRSAAAIKGGLHRYLETRRRNRELDDEFYRKLKEYYQANKMPIILEDEWRMLR